MKKILLHGLVALGCALVQAPTCAQNTNIKQKVAEKKKLSPPPPREIEMKGPGRDAIAGTILDAYGIRYIIDDTREKMTLIKINSLEHKKFTLHLYTKMFPNKQGFTYRLRVVLHQRVMDLILSAAPHDAYCQIKKGTVRCPGNTRKKK